MILDCQNISKAFGTNVILDNVSDASGWLCYSQQCSYA